MLKQYLKITSSIGALAGSFGGCVAAGEMPSINGIMVIPSCVAASILCGSVGAFLGPVGVPIALVYGGFKFVKGVMIEYNTYCILEEAKNSPSDSKE